MRAVNWAAVILTLSVCGCAQRSAQPLEGMMGGADSKSSQSREPLFIPTEFWTNVPPPSEAQVVKELNASVGRRITINGARHVVDGVAAIWIHEDTVILVPERTGWTGSPSYRSHLMVTGMLQKSDGKFELHATTYKWMDR